MSDFEIVGLRHSVDDEPNEDWTVEEVFQWTLLRSYKLFDEKLNTLADGLRNQLNEGANELEDVRKEVAGKQPLQDTENRPQNGETKSDMEVATSNDMRERSSVTLRAVVMDSEYYAGRIFELKLTKKGHCLLGRSSSKKFKNNGISLSKDLEVSTTHGKFELQKDGNVYFVDTGSTNGSKVDGVSLEADVPCLMKTGTVLLVGATKFEIEIM